jgi:hypothetical protein
MRNYKKFKHVDVDHLHLDDDLTLTRDLHVIHTTFDTHTKH